MAEYKFNPTRFREMAIAHGYTIPGKHGVKVDTARLAQVMNLANTMVWKMLNDERNPGSKGMIGLEKAFPGIKPSYFFDDTVTDEEYQQGKDEVA
jgi:transcriptional regulator with XRE-family HTH domain